MPSISKGRTARTPILTGSARDTFNRQKSKRFVLDPESGQIRELLSEPKSELELRKKRFQQLVSMLEPVPEEWLKSVPRKQNGKAASEEKAFEPTSEMKADAKSLAKSESLVEDVLNDVKALGVVGEENGILLMYIVATSRLLQRPLAAIVRGASSSGKSFLVSTIAKLMPDEQVLNATHISPKALYHAQVKLAHKFVVGGERRRNNDDASADATAALRQLISEGKITSIITQASDKGHAATPKTVEGPIAFVETTTLEAKNIFEEDLNRCLLLRMDTSEQQTQRILDAKASSAAMPRDRKDDERISGKHKAFQQSLRQLPVRIPFATEISSAMPANRPECRRAFSQVLQLVEAIALLHQHQRDVTDGQIVAKKSDYELAKKIGASALTGSLQTKLTPTLEDLLARIENDFSEREFTAQDLLLLPVQNERGMRKKLTKLVAAKCIAIAEQGSGRAKNQYRLVPAAERDLLPEI